MSDDYKIVNGYITSPGKFEGEPHWMPTLWEMVLGSMADRSLHDGTTAYDAFEMDSDLEKLTGLEAKPDTYIVVWSDQQGFVSHMIMTENEVENLEVTDPDDPDLLDSDFDDEDTLEWYDSCIPHGFNDHPEYDSGY